MTPLLHPRWTSIFLVAVVAFAWIAASNHCALAAFENVRKSAHACCEEKVPSQPQPQSAMQCCNTFNATVPVHAVVPASQLQALQPAWLETFCVAFVEPAQVRAGFHATGPPRALGFAETILNRSLLSHAPPRFVA